MYLAEKKKKTAQGKLKAHRQPERSTLESSQPKDSSDFQVNLPNELFSTLVGGASCVYRSTLLLLFVDQTNEPTKQIFHFPQTAVQLKRSRLLGRHHGVNGDLASRQNPEPKAGLGVREDDILLTGIHGQATFLGFRVTLGTNWSGRVR